MDRNKWASPEKLNRLIFGFDIISKRLDIFASKADAIASVEGLEIAEGDYLFFSADGTPMEARFSTPARAPDSSNTYSNGIYTIEPATTGENLSSLLSIVESQDKAESGLNTLRDIEQFLIDQILEKNSEGTK